MCRKGCGFEAITYCVTALQLIREVWLAAPCVLARLVTDELTALLQARVCVCQVWGSGR
jgi:hypothetical protein